MEKLIDSLYNLLIDGRKDTPQLVEPTGNMKKIEDKVGWLDDAMQDFIAEIQAAWRLHGFANGFACAMHLLGECGFNADKLTEQAEKLFELKQESPAEAAESAEDKGQEDKPKATGTAADGVQRHCFDYATSVHYLLKNIEVSADRACLLAGDMKGLHIDHGAHIRFDMLQDELCKIGKSIADWRDIYESREQAETPCISGDCGCCDETAGGVQNG